MNTKLEPHLLSVEQLQRISNESFGSPASEIFKRKLLTLGNSDLWVFNLRNDIRSLTFKTDLKVL